MMYEEAIFSWYEGIDGALQAHSVFVARTSGMLASQVRIQTSSRVLPEFVDLRPKLKVRVLDLTAKTRFDINKSRVW